MSEYYLFYINTEIKMAFLQNIIAEMFFKYNFQEFNVLKIFHSAI